MGKGTNNIFGYQVCRFLAWFEFFEVYILVCSFEQKCVMFKYPVFNSQIKNLSLFQQKK